MIIERLKWRKNHWHLDLFTPSHCQNCNHKLQAKDLIPIFSFLILRGKCRYCRKPISARIFLIEILTGLIFAGAFFSLGFNVSAIFAIILGSILAIIFFYDAKSQLIPDPLILILLVLFLIKIIFNFNPVFYSQAVFWQPILGGLVMFAFFFFIYLVTRGKGMGLGDAKLGLVLGLFIGVKFSILLLWLSFALGGSVGLFILILRLKKGADRIAFAPFLVISFLFIYFLPSLFKWFAILW